MRHFFAVLFFFCQSLVFTTEGFAQSVRQFNMLTDDISTMIPPLTVLIDSAVAHNPTLKSSDLQVIIKKYALKSDKNVWTKNLNLQADLRYGNFTNYATDNVDNIAVSTTRSELRYGVGGSVKFVVYDFLDRKNQIRMAKTEIDLANSIFEEKKSELRKIVILQYNDLILKQRLMKLSSKNIETAKINMQLVEKEFLNGVIPMTEYARISGTVSDSEVSFENARMDFLSAYMILEEIVGMKFNLVNTIPDTHERN